MKVIIILAVVTFVLSLIFSLTYSYYECTPEIEDYKRKRIICCIILYILIIAIILLDVVFPVYYFYPYLLREIISGVVCVCSIFIGLWLGREIYYLD